MKYSAIVFSLVGFFFFSSLVLAATPSVSNLSASPTTINSGQPVGFSWSLTNSGGSSFLIPCQNGIKISHADGSGNISCGTRVALSNTGGDALSLLVTNVSGATKTITLQVIPKNEDGSDYDLGMQQTQITVFTLADPLPDVSISKSTVTSGDTATLSWTGSGIDGTNLYFFCEDNVQISTPSYTATPYIPCNTTTFSSDLSGSGSLDLTFKNPTSNDKTILLRLLPAMSPGLYDGTKAKTISVTITPKIAQSANINYFAASSTTILNDTDLNVSYAATAVAGLNMYLSCDSGSVTITSTVDPNTKFPCDQKYLFNPDLGSDGVLTFHFKNTSDSQRLVTLTLVPSPITGQYDGTRAKSISIFVSKAGTTPQSQTPGAAGITNTQSSNTVSVNATGMKKARVTFTRAVRVGSRGDDVKALQEFFAQDKSIYPEGLTTGYFGPATLRAIQRFQAKNGIATSGSPETTGYGALGPKTRAFINSLK